MAKNMEIKREKQISKKEFTLLIYSYFWRFFWANSVGVTPNCF